jgi:hypothetical protein
MGATSVAIIGSPFASSIQRVVELEQSTSLSIQIQSSPPIQRGGFDVQAGPGINLDPMGLD